MDNKIVKWCVWAIFRVAILILISILFVACINFFNINNNVEKAIEKAQITLENNKDSVEKYLICIQREDTIQSKIFDDQKYMLKKHLTQMEKCLTELNSDRKGIFDTNVLTFMICFLLVFLGLILLDIESRARKHINEFDKSIHRLEVERNSSNLYTRLNTQLSFFYTSRNAYRIWKDVGHLLNEFQNDEGNEYIYSTKKWKTQFNKIIQQIILELESEKDRYPNKVDPYRDNGIERLKELQREILRLKEIKEK